LLSYKNNTERTDEFEMHCNAFFFSVAFELL